ncbi:MULTISPECIES: Fe-S cluster assembly protein SufD [Legionella]|uniref:ABC transporter permease n=1 Tax=Legionella drozanskii LLAP-1 TaxID=1212489 RepID=A0A0W0SR43_9GAMM|nr:MULTISPECIES: Fe-S cluster assembly protein SufD [Legionella]KTC85879.1 ABC transporter permease [Legionella drozanskii LLAP-1]PJE08989.1 MAG: Fe-S cluster assembly protein SufD [Legionella sp.]
MSEVIDFYQQQAKQELSTIPWLAELQAKGLRELLHRGFPTRHQEDWKYTVVDTLLQQRFIQQVQNQTSEVKPDIQSDFYLTLQNGQVFNENELASHLPKGVLIQSLATALEQHADKIKPYLGQVLRHEHGFQALNTAMLRCGVVIYLPAGVCVEQPIVLSHWQDQENQAVHNRFLIIAEEGSQATIIEDYRGAEACHYFTNTVTEVFVAKNAKLVHYKIQREAKSAYHIGHLSVKQNSASQFASHLLSLGGKLVRSDISLHLQEEKARCLLNGIYVPTEGQHMDQHTTIHHLVPHCESEQDYKGILTGRSRAVFNGKVFVAKDAQHTQAHQQNKNLLLSAQAEIDTKPQLEIFADDVICSHGATVGQLDEDALFYLATRGIGRREATSYLIRAFAADNLRLVPKPALADWMANLLNEQLR